MKKRGWMLLLALVVFGFSGVANAALSKIGTATYLGNEYNLIYEDDGPFGPITWLDYTKSAANFLVQAGIWAPGLGSSLTVNLNPGYTTTIDWSTGWRLPATIEGPYVYGFDGTTTGGYNISSSEMGHLYYVSLGNQAILDTNGNYNPFWIFKNYGDFNNLLQNNYYWSDTEHPPYYAWIFSFDTGSQDYGSREDVYYGLAVRPGEVSTVPVPSTLLLLASGLVGLGAYRRRREQDVDNLAI